MSCDFDLAVVGGGPAGCAAALEAARHGLAVGLWEARGGERDKPCGEGLLPSGAAALRELGLGAVLQAARPFRCVTYRTPGPDALELSMPETGYALRRPRLQALLDEALAEAGVARFTGSARTRRLQDGHGIDAGRTWVARTLVAADGLGGSAAGWLRRDGWSSGRTGVRARYLRSAELTSVEVHLGAGCEVYLTPLPDGEVNVAFLFERLPPTARGGEELSRWALERHPRAAAVLASRTTAPAARRLERPAPRTVASQGAFLAGDAGGGVDPVLGCGLSIALSTGRAAGRAAAEVVQGGSSYGGAECAYARAHAREMRWRRRLAWVLRRAARSPALLGGMLRGADRLPRAALAPLIRVAVGRVDP